MKSLLSLKVLMLLILTSSFSYVNATVVAENISHSPALTYTSIQAAIDAANDGDEIVIHPGTHQVNLAWDKDITIGSKYLIDNNESWIASTILDGSGTGTIVKVSPYNTVKFKGLTFQNGKTTSSSYASAISLRYYNDVVVDKCVFKNHVLSSYSYVVGSTSSNNEVLINDCEFKNVSGPGSCVRAYYSEVTISNSEFHSNSLSYQELIKIEGGSTNAKQAEITNCLFYNNYCDNVIYIRDQDAVINHVTMFDNDTHYSTSRSVWFRDYYGQKTYSLSNSIIWESEQTGKVLVDVDGRYQPANATIEDCFIAGGRDRIKYGENTVWGLIMDKDPKFVSPTTFDLRLQDDSPCLGFATVTDITSDIAGNTRPTDLTQGTPPDVGAFENAVNNSYRAYCTTTDAFYSTIQEAIDNCKSYNDVYVYPGIHNENLTIASKGNIRVKSVLYKIKWGVEPEDFIKLADKVVLDGGNIAPVVKYVGDESTIADCVMLELVTVQNGKALDPHGGGVFGKDASVSADYCVFKDNSAKYGGAIAIWGASTHGVIENCEFHNNYSSSHGGAIFAVSNSSVNIKDVLFKSNVTGANGGALWVNGAESLTFQRSKVVDGVSQVVGSGILALYTANVNILESEFINGTGYNAVSLYNCSGNAKISQTSFVGNTGRQVLSLESVPTKIENVLIADNTVTFELVNARFADFDMSYTTIAGNTYNSTSTVVNYDLLSGSPYTFTCRNSIFWDNVANQFALHNDVGTVDIGYSVLRGGEASITGHQHTVIYDNASMLTVDPMFDENYHLSNSSPCLGAALFDDMITSDLEGTYRDWKTKRADIGAFENPIDDTYYAAKNIVKEGYNYYTSINAAVEDANESGDTILVYPGSHKVELEYTKDIVFTSVYLDDEEEYMVDETILYAVTDDQLLNISSSKSEFIGLTFDGAYTYGEPSVYLGSYSEVVMRNCVISGLRTYGNGGNTSLFYSRGEYLEFDNCEFTLNGSFSNTDLFRFEGPDVKFSKTKVHTNLAEGSLVYAGQLYSSGTAKVVFENTLFENNYTDNLFDLRNVDVEINHCTVAGNNKAGENSGPVLIASNSSYEHVVKNTIIYGNEFGMIDLAGTGNRSFDKVLLEGGVNSFSGSANPNFVSPIISGSPNFENVEERDFRIQAGSAAIGAGVATEVSEDIKGNSRSSSSVDLGCYVYGAGEKAYVAEEDDSELFEEELADEVSNVEVYPIPLKEILYVKGGEFEAVQIFNMSGKAVVSSQEDAIDVSELTKGSYFIQVSLPDGTVKSFKATK